MRRVRKAKVLEGRGERAHKNVRSKTDRKKKREKKKNKKKKKQTQRKGSGSLGWRSSIIGFQGNRLHAAENWQSGASKRPSAAAPLAASGAFTEKNGMGVTRLETNGLKRRRRPLRGFGYYNFREGGKYYRAEKGGIGDTVYLT